MKRDLTVLVVSASPDHLNSNANLRDFVAEGFGERLPDGKVASVAYERGLAAVTALRPDLTVLFGSVMIDGTSYVRMLEEARRHGRVAVWVHDDPYEFDAFGRALPLADVFFTNDEAALDFYPAEAPVHHLPLAASAKAHFRPVDNRVGPALFFCGHLYDNRRRFLDQLARRVPELQNSAILVGTGLPSNAVPGWTEARLPNSKVADFNSTALAVLNIGRDLNLANTRFAIKASTPGPRTFEAALSGAAQILVTDGLEILNYFADGEEILLADTADDFVAHWLRLQADPALSVRLGENAQRRCSAHHTYAHRAERILEVVLG